jgi:hypothetical protein
MFITRRVFTTALSVTGLAAFAGFSPLRLIADAMAQARPEGREVPRCCWRRGAGCRRGRECRVGHRGQLQMVWISARDRHDNTGRLK